MSQEVFLVERHDLIMESPSIAALRTTRELAEQFIREQGTVLQWTPYERKPGEGETPMRCVLWARIQEKHLITESDEQAVTDGEITREGLEELRTEEVSYSINVYELI